MTLHYWTNGWNKLYFSFLFLIWFIFFKANGTLKASRNSHQLWNGCYCLCFCRQFQTILINQTLWPLAVLLTIYSLWLPFPCVNTATSFIHHFGLVEAGRNFLWQTGNLYQFDVLLYPFYRAFKDDSLWD